MDFELAFTTVDGKKVKLENFKEPMTLRLKLNGASSKLAAIYYISNEGKLEYIGGKIVKGEIVATFITLVNTQFLN